ncbi:hypothetical protein TNIN_17621 [Trichonephila inaurata madagascariensis]|uniref:Uncharacterized protein n=1 Tax=Trichonephila inaurata madagascariensis TaxID=2747483 RepID=A0A8X6YAQ1_9ARAC|nr:hypothetical protein TNIN_17621 [Trichonephila inaurata madagascariensis]
MGLSQGRSSFPNPEIGVVSNFRVFSELFSLEVGRFKRGLRRWSQIRIRKEGRLTEIATREGCRHPPRRTIKLKRQAEGRRRTMDRF